MNETGKATHWWSAKWVRATFSLAVVVLIFGFFFPKIADYGAVWETITDMTWLELWTLGAVALWNLVSYWPMLTAVQPTLRLREAAVANLASTSVSNTMPGGGALAIGVTMSMQRSWGHPVAETTLAMVVSGVWNNFVKLGLPIVALGLLALNGEAGAGPGRRRGDRSGRAGRRHRGVRPAPAQRPDGRRWSDARPGVAVSAALGILRRPPVTGWDVRAVAFRAEVVALLSRRWLRITITSLVSHLSLFLVLLLALRHVGVSNEEVSWQLVLAAFSFVRLVSAIPITPGGLGLVELGLTAALGAGLPESTRNQIAAAVLRLSRPDVAAADPPRRRVLGLLAGQQELAPRRAAGDVDLAVAGGRELTPMARRRLGRALVLAVVGVVVALHVVRPELDPLAHRLSDYANGDHGWLMAVAFALMAAAALVLAPIVAAAGRTPGRRRVIRAAMVVAGVRAGRCRGLPHRRCPRRAHCPTSSTR